MMKIKFAPVRHPNAIDAVFIDYRNRGFFWMGQLGGSPLSIHKWRDREKDRWRRAQKEKK